ncbi:MAG: hypothetical protein AB3N13_01195 [Arenibacterium sp.]
MIRFALITVLFASPVIAEDFSEGSEARSWNLYAEVPARFEAKVVDLLCELSGDCPADCGAGKRQMGLIRTVDNVMVLPLKNSQPAFSGAASDLAPFCNQIVTVDGLLLEDPDLLAKNLYQVQTITTAEGETVKANQFTKNWAKENPGAEGKGPWFRRDPRIKADIAENGYLGLGLEADAVFIADWF